MFDPKKPVQTSDGLPARVIATDRRGFGCPIVALVDRGDGRDAVFPARADGFHFDGVERLVNVDTFALPGRDIVRTRDGRRAWIFTRTADAARPIMGLIEGAKAPRGWHASGRCDDRHDGVIANTDLILES